MVGDPGARALLQDLEQAVRGEVRFDRQSRALYSMDASNFRHLPIGVVVPKDVHDVVETVRVCHEHGVPIVSRGGGTGIAGQSLNVAVVIDHSKYLRDVLQIDATHRRARVLAGTVLDDLRARAKRHGLTYGPDPSTHTHCTVGGMIGNNACGVHGMLSEFYGAGPRTEDNVASLEVLTYDGVRMTVGPTSDAEYAEIQRQGGRRAEILRRLRQLAERYGDAIREGFPRIPRRVSGYNLPALLPEHGFDVAKALVGSESTCVTVLEATVKLCPHFPARALVLLGYDSVFEAGDDIPRIRELEPIGLEGIDDKLVQYIKENRLGHDTAELLPEGKGWLFVELGASTKEEAVARAHATARILAGSRSSLRAKVIEDEQEQLELWTLRESGLGATAFVQGRRDAWEGWEDSAVPVDQLGTYLRRLRALYDEYGYTGSIYGHFGQGCVHTRITFELESEEGIAQYRRFTREAAELCVSLGGSLSGEHGDGQQRSDLLPVMYGPEIMQAFREFKAIWDPQGKMNPGRIVDPASRTDDLRLHPIRAVVPKTRFAFPEDGGSFAHAALRCVGVGKCRVDQGIMCPSYKVTLEEEHTTRGRARLLHEMVKGGFIDDGWRSQEVKDSLELCLSCKGCKRDCPVDVDMATYKAEFLSHYYEHEPRPRHAYALGWIHRWLRLGTAVPRLANFATHTKGLSWLAKRAGGIATERSMPEIARRSFRRSFRPQRGNGGRRVMLWLDCFNDAFFPQALEATTEVLHEAGCDVVIPRRPLCCGRALYDYGMLDLATSLWRETLDELGPEIEAGTLLVGAEPSCVAAFRDELPNLFPGDPRAEALCRNTHTLAELLLDRLDGFEPPARPGRALYHGHCHQGSIMGTERDQELLRRMGLHVEVPEPGCCGMAGAFGYEADKYEISRAIGEQRLLPAVRRADDEVLVVADGFSCREQISQLSGRRPLHVAEVLAQALRDETTVGGVRQPERDPSWQPQRQVERHAVEPAASARRVPGVTTSLAVSVGLGGLVAWLLYGLGSM